ncbi:MAG TPA: hypothetical protein PL126_03215 [Candidatus Cloacimonadota bacterium]|nr:hypothetical protein [Candidatus Cloacimonadota bacterium]
MSNNDAGSKLQVRKLVQGDENKIVNLVKRRLESCDVQFSDYECCIPNQSDIKESTIETFLKKVRSSSPYLDHDSLKGWWAVSGGKPNWDFISTCSVNRIKGLLLVEAKSHYEEMEIGGKLIRIVFAEDDRAKKIRETLINKLGKKSLKIEPRKDGQQTFSVGLTPKEVEKLQDLLYPSTLDDKMRNSLSEKLKNHDIIGNDISNAREALLPFCDEIKISHDSHYQLSNRIAYTWKLASLGVPTILLYLGFLNDPYWISKRKRHFGTDGEWLEEIKRYFKQVGAHPLLDKKKITLPNGMPMFFITGSLPAK